MIIGHFKFDTEDKAYRGDIVSLTWSRSNVNFLPNNKKSDKEPDYRVVWGREHVVEFGAAWKRTSERGQEFLSVSIDDPALPGAINAALFVDEEGESATLVWTRPKPKATPDAKPKAKAT